ncbi:hypothetical protein GBAR_LOCUS24940 [Geodia barretti]|uniref:Uncharacterized protein n=1 Tax=Geodia barretti TaxID=519541 RepID=A0AA35XA74_GEOBA|nr:hypothetical protein GBAR_LOCUS24940 [Geodia barretti]
MCCIPIALSCGRRCCLCLFTGVQLYQLLLRRRLLCYLIHHYNPSLLPLHLINIYATLSEVF